MINPTEHPLSQHASIVLHQTVSSQAHTRTRYPDNCRQLKFPSILVLCQEEATREPSAALETLAHSAADADEPLAAACCNFLNSDCNAGLN